MSLCVRLPYCLATLAIVLSAPAFAQMPGRACPGASGRTLPTDRRVDSAVTAANKDLRPVAFRLHYPENLRIRGVEGSVRASFVLDTAGRVLPGTVVITFESQWEFGNSVCAYLRSARYLSASPRSTYLLLTDIEFVFRLRSNEEFKPSAP